VIQQPTEARLTLDFALRISRRLARKRSVPQPRVAKILRRAVTPFRGFRLAQEPDFGGHPFLTSGKQGSKVKIYRFAKPPTTPSLRGGYGTPSCHTPAHWPLTHTAAVGVRWAIRDDHRLGNATRKGDPKAALCVGSSGLG
jgi:hypothetical protein